jgi:predicted nucleotidyltransferase
MPSGSVRDAFTAALERLIEQVKEDRSILAAILCGSLSHDTVWEKSDIDLVLVTVDDRQAPSSDVALYADGRNVHALLMPRVEFRRLVDGSIANSFVHSFLAKGRLLYTHDQTIADVCARLQQRGERDTTLQLLRAATTALPPLDKARKWLVTRRDLDYTALWILYAATPLARIEVLSAGLIADREVLPQAMALNPPFFTVVYSDLLNVKKTKGGVETALAAADCYLADRAATLFRPILEHLRDVGEARSCTEIENHFKRHCDLSGVTIACEYLSDRGLIGKASTAVRLTKKSNIDMQELAFFHLDASADA